MTTLTGAGVNSLEGTVILKHLSSNIDFNASGYGIVERAYKRGRPARISGVLVGALFKICTGSESGVSDHKAVRNEPPDVAASSRVNSNLCGLLMS
eukprot:jgi/Tetstr1/453645/TSEL_040601.t1